MKNVFLSGSRSLSQLNRRVVELLDFFIETNAHFLVGSADGADALFQKYLANKNYTNVTVYTIYPQPRNLASNKFTVKVVKPREGLRGRQAQMEKDRAMCKDCDVALVYWNGESKGSKVNWIRCFRNKGKQNIFVISKFDVYYTETTEIYSIISLIDAILFSLEQGVSISKIPFLIYLADKLHVRYYSKAVTGSLGYKRYKNGIRVRNYYDALAEAVYLYENETNRSCDFLSETNMKVLRQVASIFGNWSVKELEEYCSGYPEWRMEEKVGPHQLASIRENGEILLNSAKKSILDG